MPRATRIWAIDRLEAERRLPEHLNVMITAARCRRGSRTVGSRTGYGVPRIVSDGRPARAGALIGRKWYCRPWQREGRQPEAEDRARTVIARAVWRRGRLSDPLRPSHRPAACCRAQPGGSARLRRIPREGPSPCLLDHGRGCPSAEGRRLLGGRDLRAHGVGCGCSGHRAAERGPRGLFDEARLRRQRSRPGGGSSSRAHPNAARHGAARCPEDPPLSAELFGRPFSEALDLAMRGPSDWTPGERELFAGFVSSLNQCLF